MGKRAIGSFFAVFTAITAVAAAQEPAAPIGPEAYFKLDETSGSSAANSVPGGVTGAYNGTPVPSTNVNSPPISYANPRSLSFNGSSSVVVPNFGTFNQTTVSVWVNRTGTTGTRQSIVSYKEGTGVNMGFVLCLNENGSSHYPRLHVQINGGWTSAEQAVAVPTGTWVHLAGTYDGTMIRLFRNGVQVATGGGAGIMTNSGVQNMVIGARASYDQHYYPGLADDVRVYSRALSANDIAVLAAGCPLPRRRRGPTAPARSCSIGRRRRESTPDTPTG